MCGRTAIVALMLAAGGCSTRDTDVFPLPFAQAQQRLIEGDFTPFRNGRQCGILIHIVPERRDDGVHWQVTSSGAPVLGFAALLTPVDATHTKVTIRVDRDADGQEQYDGTRFYPRPAVHQPIAPGVREQVAAILEDRPFDIDRALGPKSENDSVCNVQRATFEESGTPFSVHGDEDATGGDRGDGNGNWGAPAPGIGGWGR